MAVTNIGTNIDTSRITAQLTEQYDYVYGAVGMYPTEVYAFETSDAMEQLRSLVTEHERVVAIGEIGLDYHYDNIDKALQQKWFEAQMNLARELNVPIVVHSRDAAQALRDYIRIIQEEYQKRSGAGLDPLAAATEKYKAQLGHGGKQHG